MTETPSSKKTIPVSLILAALVNFIGIILIGYGHLLNKNIVFYVGLIIVLVGVLLSIFRIIIQGVK